MFFVNVNGVKVGYMRISTSDGKQCLDLQETALIEAGVSPNKIYSDMESGAKEDRPGFMYADRVLSRLDWLHQMRFVCFSFSETPTLFCLLQLRTKPEQTSSRPNTSL